MAPVWGHLGAPGSDICPPRFRGGQPFHSGNAIGAQSREEKSRRMYQNIRATEAKSSSAAAT